MQIKNKRHIVLFIGFVGLLGIGLVNGTNWAFLSSNVFWQQAPLSNLQVALMTLTITPYFAYKMLQVSQLSDDLAFTANHDHLTNASTRAHLYRQVQLEPLWPAVIILCDLDRFKAINDSFGHKAGDAVLKHFTSIARQKIRSADLLARFGGEEFVIVLRQSHTEGGERLAQEICQDLANKPLCYDGHKIHVTASFGVTTCTHPGMIEEAIGQADRAMYQAKETGRNRVVMAAHLADQRHGTAA